MARPLRIAYPGAFYHVTSRGNEQKDVFKSRSDREKFLDYLASATERYGAVIHAYCLMGNHYHLLLETPNGNLAQIMRHINGAYTTYFNVKRRRAGHLFQGRYKAILVEADTYATELSRYIHLNPVRAGITGKPEEYPWSSYGSYIGQVSPPAWLKRDFILGYFGKQADAAKKHYCRFVEELVGKEQESPFQGAIGTAILGTAEFREAIAAQHLPAQGMARDLPALRHFSSRPSLAEILAAVQAVLGENQKLTRQAGMYLCHRTSGEKLRTIGELFRVGESAISEASRLFTRKMEGDRDLREAVARIRELLKV